MSDTIPAREECFTFGQLLWYFMDSKHRVHDHIQRQYDEVRRFFEAIQSWGGVDLGDERDEPGRSLKTMKQFQCEVAKLARVPFSVVEALPLTAFVKTTDLAEQPTPPLKERATTNTVGQEAEKQRTSTTPLADGSDADASAELLGVAATLGLKGIELQVVQRIVAGRGSVPIVDLATLCKWENQDDNWNSTRKRLNNKLRSKGWELYRHDNQAKVKRLAQPKSTTAKKTTAPKSSKAGGRK